jgi:two-component system chemotaxis response regulator CheB
MPTRRDIIVIGASAGGVEAVGRVLGDLPADLPAAVFVVVHTTPHGPSVLPRIFNRVSKLRAAHALDGERIALGRVYVAPPDFHMIIDRGGISVVRGPMENHTRPAIDPLFRSAALRYGPQVIGVILTGCLDDGTAGMVSVKARDGIAIVQDPADAREPSMPRSALEHVKPDHVLPLRMIGPTLAQLAGEPVHPDTPANAPEALTIETRMAAAEPTMREETPVEKLGPTSAFTCPECHGTLYEVVNGKPLRFRCRVGHAYSARSLMADQTTALEATLWTVLRSLEESAALAHRIADSSRSERGAKHLRDIAEHRAQQAEEIRRGLLAMRTTPEEEPV